MTQTAQSSPLDALPVDRLKSAGQDLLKTLIDRAVSAALDQVDGITDRLGDVAENGGEGLSNVFGGGSDGEGGGGGGIGGALSSAGSKLKGALGNVVPGLGGGDDDDEEGEGGGSGGGGGNKSARGKFKFLNIFEVQDVGVPLRLAYDQWTQFADFPSFMKKVENVDQSSDEKVTWKAQVFWSHRTWETTIVEQIPDSHILWTSSGAKGHASGIVTFSELAPNLTRIVLIMEYYPQGFFEKTGNIWRAVGRRARLEFKHFCRHVMMDSLVNRDQIVGWRGEIRDSEVVRTHEEAMEEEQAAEEGYDEDGYEDEAADEEDGYDDELDEDEEPEDEPVAEDDLDDSDLDDVEDADDVAEDEDDVEDVDDSDADFEDEDDEDEDAGDAEDSGSSNGRPARRRSRRAERANA
ncbi:SRPBCC family protein [Actinomycetospora sp. TBRC 11914]|uniref:SRPBCC family protein n=1 Tax=Actinomycetospora sp. TBRC 11914 TaxID=2729387 RepID=UPI00145E1445|nr:SRPBCC family protein [Actinomycetospora sp. TBRC 11914]NMO88598.1 SRPBCC family protein [Actinomycetospora sp. TBRC 11914]